MDPENKTSQAIKSRVQGETIIIEDEAYISGKRAHSELDDNETLNINKRVVRSGKAYDTKTTSRNIASTSINNNKNDNMEDVIMSDKIKQPKASKSTKRVLAKEPKHPLIPLPDVDDNPNSTDRIDA
jgi:hypothetical protein